jgi:hypothetical protein
MAGGLFSGGGKFDYIMVRLTIKFAYSTVSNPHTREGELMSVLSV